MSNPNQENGFAPLGLGPRVNNLLDKLGFTQPTPIQALAIPVANDGVDVVGIAQTGTGKTLAFGLPIVRRITERVAKRALVLAPTRELALQIDETFQKVGRPLGIRTAVLIGGASMGRQIAQIRSKPQVIVATPGRLTDHLFQRTLDLRDVDIVVLDEADRMLDMGFAPAITKILLQVPEERQTMLFSATMPETVESLAARFQRGPKRLEVERPGTTSTLVTQELRLVDQTEKVAELARLLDETSDTVLVFSRTRHGARKLAKAVHHHGHDVAELHSDRSLAQRRDALDGFKSGRYRVLVATDIAARGIDVKAIGLVVNYDLPDNPEDYVHRIGRTGRAGHEGRAITFATPEQSKDVRDLERAIRQEIPRAVGVPADFGRAPAPRPRGPRPQGEGAPHNHGRRPHAKPFGSANGPRRGPSKPRATR